MSRGDGRPRAWFSAMLGALAPLLGCGGPALPVTESQSGDHLVYAWEPALTPCAGTVTAMDEFIPFVSAQLGVDPEELDLITYTWLTRDEFHARRPDDQRPIDGYCHGVDAYAAEPALLHELVHAVDAPRLGGRTFFTEGLAVAFAPDLGGGSRYVRSDPRPYLTAEYDDDIDTVRSLYATGGAFVAYLVSRHGPERLLDLHDRLGVAASESRIRRVFADVYDRDLDDAVREFLDDDCPKDARESPTPHACAGETIAWATATTWFDARTLACDAPEAVGGHGGGGSIASVAVTLEIPEDGAYELRAFGDRHLRAVLASCGRCPWLAFDPVIDERPTIAGLKAGRHALIYRGEARAVSLAGVQIVRAPEHDDATP